MIQSERQFTGKAQENIEKKQAKTVLEQAKIAEDRRRKSGWKYLSNGKTSLQVHPKNFKKYLELGFKFL